MMQEFLGAPTSDHEQIYHSGRKIKGVESLGILKQLAKLFITKVDFFSNITARLLQDFTIPIKQHKW